jgi:Tfp pilus assembly protein PilW
MATPQPRDGGEAGFTIMELVITSAILLLTVSATLSMLVASWQATDFSTRRGETQDDVRIAMDRLTKDLRQVTRFNTIFTTSVTGSWTGNDLDFLTYTAASPDVPVRVRWWVSAATLHRQ